MTTAGVMSSTVQWGGPQRLCGACTGQAVRSVCPGISRAVRDDKTL